jgi:ribosomal protein S18 acetylase RimI-like enzyme
MECWPEEDGTRVYLTLGWILPEWRGRGIGTAMLHGIEARCLRMAAEEYPGERSELAANASSTECDSQALLEQEGYAVGYTVLEMDYDVRQPVVMHPLPEGLEVRPVLPEQYARLAESVRDAYVSEYEGDRFNEGCDAVAFAEGLRHPRHDPTLWSVAWDGDRIAGQVLAVLRSGGRAEVFEVSVGAAWRRQGLGRALLSRTLQILVERQVKVLRLYTNESFRTRAQDLYRSVGFRLVKKFPRYRKPFPVG